MEPTRYHADTASAEPEGAFVMYRDYAPLRAECDALRAALVELVACDEIVKHQQHADGTKVRGGRWKAAWEAARAALAAKEGERA